MRTFFLFVASGILASAQSHPGWWTFAAPESKSLVGIAWLNLRDSPFGEVVRAELSNSGTLSLPDLPCLMNARDFLLSSPPFLAAANGACSPAALRTDALSVGMTPVRYRGTDLWIAPSRAALSVATFGDRVVLIGLRKSLEAAIDRSLAETHTYSPLLMTGARVSRSRDLWVVATELPDPLASVFVPLDVSAGNFEGGITLRDGLDLAATFDAGTDLSAKEVSTNLRKSILQLPAVAKGLRVSTHGSSVALTMRVAQGELQAGLRQPDAVSPPVTTFPARPAVPASAIPTPPVRAGIPGGIPSTTPAKLEPQIIRIFGLDDGPREIVLPPKEPR